MHFLNKSIYLPPKGVRPRFEQSYFDSLATARLNGTDKTPLHVLVTDYRYNSLNQVVSQSTPDAGISRFYYDRLGRLVISQNAKQAAVGNGYSYTLYDLLGRISEVGQTSSATAMTQATSSNATSLQNWLNASGTNRNQITQTVYDQAYTPTVGLNLSQANLRNRVSYSVVFNQASDTYPASATYYSYDIHGNVDTLVQDFGSRRGVPNAMNEDTLTYRDRFKRIVYNYDLISGKVNQVSYQPGKYDSWYHRYQYDAENRLTEVVSGRDSVMLFLFPEREAQYSYYKHGPLAQTGLGKLLVQRLDYAYTLQGWLKAINPAMGGTLANGTDTTEPYPVAQDVYGFSLHYFKNDYKPVGTYAGTGSSSVLASLGSNANALYNGNIAAMAVNIPKIGLPQVYNYRYDQLNRLVAMDAYTGLSIKDGNFPNPLNSGAYKEQISYDPNGNILTYLRNGDTARKPMDNLQYSYYPNTNQLRQVADLAINSSAIDYPKYNDIQQNQLDSNYRYDQIGNMIQDSSEKISNITWTVYGKISTITKNGAVIRYTYDASGNRISKQTTSDTTYYVRDASGNVMAVYSRPAGTGSKLGLAEVHLYGSSRLGMTTSHLAADSAYALGIGYDSAKKIIFTRGEKFFELTNHLGNVLVTVTDRRIQLTTNNTDVSAYRADIASANDYYPFGMLMPGRRFTASTYRYGFNGKENDNNVKGEGNEQDYGMRIYDSRIGKFLSVDPITSEYPELTPYQFASNRPIDGIDIDGLEWIPPMKCDKNGTWVPDGNEALKNNTAIANIIAQKHRQGMSNVRIAEQARQQAIQQGRTNGDGITWWTKAMVYIAPFWNSTATLSDANDGAVLLRGKNLDGSDATVGDYVAAGVGIFIPFVSGGALKKAGSPLIEGTIGIYKNGKEIRELAFKIGKYGHKGTKEYNSILKAIKSGGNIVANSKDEALQFLKEAMPGITDESGKAASKFGYRIENVSDEVRDGIMQGHQGLHINYYDKENRIKGTIIIEELPN